MNRNQSVWDTPIWSNQISEIVYRSAMFSVLLSVIVLMSGCSERDVRLPTHKVSGKVTQNGKGVPNATVILHANRTEEGFIKPRAITKQDGSFELTTYESGDGAPVGDYEVSIEQWVRVQPDEPPANRLPPALSKPSTSGLKAVVAAAEKTLSPFELK